MPVVVAPVVIAPIVDFTEKMPRQTFAGPFVLAGNLYLSLYTFSVAEVYKSADTGATWALKDEVNEPGFTPDTYFDFTFLNGAGALVCFGIRGDGDIQAAPFTPDAWDMAVKFTPAKTPLSLYFVQLSSGVVRVIYDSSGPNAINFADFTAGAWGMETTSALSFNAFGIKSALIDATDTTHVLLVNTLGALQYLTISALGVVSASVTIAAAYSPGGNDTPGDENNITYPGQPLALGSVLIFPYVATSGSNHAAALVSTDGGLNWASIDIAGSEDPTWTDYETTAVLDSFGNIYVYWSVQSDDFSVSRIYRARWNGATFNAPELFWDAIALPPTGLLTPGWIRYVSIVSQSGQIRGTAAVATDGEQFELEPIYFFAEDLDPLSITCDNPPEGVVGVAYSHFFPATGGTPPYAFAVTFGALPDGLALDPVTGEVSGIPTVAGTFGFTIEVTDDDANTDSVECSIDIAESVLDITCDDPPDGPINVAYSHFFPASGGILPYTFAITAGALPTGLSLDAATGEVSGTPTVLGLFTFTIQVTDADDETAEVECSILIVDPLIIECDNPPVGKINLPYSHFFPASLGVEPYTWSISAGSLPPGLSLNGTTGEVSGVPTTSGTYTFTITVVDDVDGTASVECSIVIKTCLVSE